MLDKLTPEQENLILCYQEKWRNIALSTERINRPQADLAVKEIYRLCNLDEPEVVFCESPYEAMSKTLPKLERLIIQPLHWGFLQLRFGILNLFSPRKEIYIDNLALERSSDIYTHIQTTLYFQFILQMKDISQQLQIDIADAIELQINTNITELYHQLTEQLGEQYDSNFIPAASFCSYCSWLDYWSSGLNYSGDQKLLQTFQLVAESCGWIFPYQRVAVVCDRPTKLCFDNQNRLHAEGEPAIQFADGYSLYAYHGVTLPEKYGKLHPHQWQSSWLLAEKNAELRRVLIQGIGYARIIAELQAIELDSYQEYTLLKIENEVDVEPIYLLKMTCPSTGFIHVLRVPPDVKSAREAIVWVNWGITPEEFAVQT
ncbi:MAG: hypothetical protein IGS49_28145 [Chlorogloeopsis fritschii C42_A2020_084]|uniref:DUF6745 domain-containing protein n=1 Tax=Chlorogloeopsis fritschii TaxID=1124 RepID=UPI0019E30382|nr:hypothetical protein [Chlorogloeopsis fritschii]MBF2009209.1 hypothetical protein [Chlorogloeopsis fritschii C42_A2020_084]